jgi:peptidylprolyl isomerase
VDTVQRLVDDGGVAVLGNHDEAALRGGTEHMHAEARAAIEWTHRQLDRNITVVGRVVQGMELLSVLPRGTGPLGFYEKPEQYAGIQAIRLAQDVPTAERTPLQVLRTDTPLFDELVEARRNRRDAFYKRPAGHINVCNVPLPTRAPPAG